MSGLSPFTTFSDSVQGLSPTAASTLCAPGPLLHSLPRRTSQAPLRTHNMQLYRHRACLASTRNCVRSKKRRDQLRFLPGPHVLVHLAGGAVSVSRTARVADRFWSNQNIILDDRTFQGMLAIDAVISGCCQAYRLGCILPWCRIGLGLAAHCPGQDAGVCRNNGSTPRTVSVASEITYACYDHE